MEELKKNHPEFIGNWLHLMEFMSLVNSPIRSVERGDALEKWVEFKKNTQILALQQNNPDEKILTKSGYINSLREQAIDLRGAKLDGITLGYVDMRAVLLDGSSMRGVRMKGAQFQNSSLKNVNFSASENGDKTLLVDADFDYADLTGAQLRGADLSSAKFKEANLQMVDLSFCNLSHSIFTRSDLSGATIANSRVYGIAAWDLNKEGTTQHDLLIEENSDMVSVDDLEVAQFIYLLLNNKNLTSVISTIGQKGVLILGRFTPERKKILDGIRDKIRADYNLLPIVFDFERAKEKDFTETVQILAGLSRFVIADITNPKSSPLELQATVPNFMIPFITILEEGSSIFSMFTDLWKKHSDRVTKPVEYQSLDQLIAHFDIAIMDQVKHIEESLSELKMVDYVASRKLSDMARQ